MFFWLFSPLYTYCTTKPADEGAKWLQEKFVCEAHITDFAVAIFTGFLVLATIGLWLVTRSQVRVTRDALIADKRAFVFADGFSQYYELDARTGLYNWRFRPNWHNSGDTPTQSMTMISHCMLCNSPLPTNFDFNASSEVAGNGLLAPKGTAQGSLAPRIPCAAITPQDIVDVQEGRKYLYFWGWAKYHDVFPDTPLHTTRFCWLITPTGNPSEYTPDNRTVQFPYLFNSQGNSANDE